MSDDISEEKFNDLLCLIVVFVHPMPLSTISVLKFSYVQVNFEM